MSEILKKVSPPTFVYVFDSNAFTFDLQITSKLEPINHSSGQVLWIYNKTCQNIQLKSELKYLKNTRGAAWLHIPGSVIEAGS